MLFIAIETSCDETSICILQGDKNFSGNSFYDYINSFEVKSSIISSQINIHKKYGGVVPEIGAREHSKQIHFVFRELVMKLEIPGDFNEKIKYLTENLQEIFVTTEPGLKSALRVGIEFAKSLRYYLEKESGKKFPINNINHLNGHLISCFFDKNHKFQKDNEIFPHLHLIVSGGNSQILVLDSASEWEIIGATLDDAAGESFDKIGRMLGLPYPGGVWISKIAGENYDNPMNFPIGMSKNKTIAYSFSGLKTSVRNYLEKPQIPGFDIEQKLTESELKLLVDSNSKLNPKLDFIKKVCISAQTVIIRQLTNKLSTAIIDRNIQSIGLSGGVSANPMLRKYIQNVDSNLPLLLPPMSLTGDNAVMIGLAGLSKYYQNHKIQ